MRLLLGMSQQVIVEVLEPDGTVVAAGPRAAQCVARMDQPVSTQLRPVRRRVPANVAQVFLAGRVRDGVRAQRRRPLERRAARVADERAPRRVLRQVRGELGVSPEPDAALGARKRAVRRAGVAAAGTTVMTDRRMR